MSPSINNESIKKIVEKIVGRKIENNESLFSSQLLDSMAKIDLTMELENNFDIEIDPDDITELNFENILNITDYVNSKIKK